MADEEETDRIDDFEPLKERFLQKFALREQRHHHAFHWAVFAAVLVCSVGSLVYLAITKDERPVTFVVGLLLGRKIERSSHDPPG